MSLHSKLDCLLASHEEGRKQTITTVSLSVAEERNLSELADDAECGQGVVSAPGLDGAPQVEELGSWTGDARSSLGGEGLSGTGGLASEEQIMYDSDFDSIGASSSEST
jgi:hypothetical protein